MDPKIRIAPTLRECISCLDFYEGEVQPFSWSEVGRDFLAFCLERQLLTSEEVVQLISRRLLQVGRQMYRLHIRSLSPLRRPIIYPDHLPSPHALAYAFRHGEFSDREMRSVKFDHGDTAESFLTSVDATFPEQILQKLLQWKDPVRTQYTQADYEQFDPATCC